MADVVETDEDLLPSIRQLIKSVVPSLHTVGSLSTAEDVLYHLEETDEDFHRYEFVKYVKNKIEEVLGPLIEDKLDKIDYSEQNRGSEEALIQIITNHVISDPICIEMLRSLRFKTKNAVERLLMTYDDSHPQQPLSYQSISSNYDQHVMHSYSTSDESSSFDSSFNQSAFLFLSQDHFVSIAENLEPKNPIEVRIEAMQSLLRIPVSDVVACEQWDTLRVSLLVALNDKDEQLSDKSLRFHARMFSSNSHSILREVYLSLGETFVGDRLVLLASSMEEFVTKFRTWKEAIENKGLKVNLEKTKVMVNRSSAERVHHLASCFTSGLTRPMALSDGIDFADLDTGNLLRKFRLMNEFQIEAESYWIRFPERFLHEVIEATFQLLQTETPTSSISLKLLSPSHFMAVIDPKARWFKTWMHGDYSRRAVIQLIRSKKSLIKAAVDQCLWFISVMLEVDAVSALSKRLDRQRLGSSDHRRTTFTEKDVQFLCFYHNISLLGRLLCYKNGRALFPVQLSDEVTAVSVSNFVLSLIHLVTDHLEPSLVPGIETSFLSSCRTDIVTEIIKTLCTIELACSECLLKDSIVMELLKPVRRWLQHGKVSSDCTMLHVAEILTGMASWESGKQLLLYGENGECLTNNKCAAVHVFAEFCQQTLDCSTESDCPPKQVIGAYLSLCQQLYNNCEGLHILYPYELHHYVANAWRKASRESAQGATPTMENVGLPSTSQFTSDMWEQTLINHLLNFAGTPKGLFLLQKAGALNETVAYMYSRYARKLQASKTEKFGYGFIVTQIASTAPGMIALQNTGFIKALIYGVWSVLECGKDDDQPCSNPHQLSVGDKAVQKVFILAHSNCLLKSTEANMAAAFTVRVCMDSEKCFIRLVNVVSSYQGTYELLAGQSLANKEVYTFRDFPDNLPALMDRIIMVNSEVKSHFLFNEQTQVFGLRLLSMMGTCLDLWLLLETQYNLWDYLLSEQNSNRNDESGEIMVDHLSVERHHILVQTNVIGGPSERVLPGRALTTGEVQYPWKMFSSFPVPKEYFRAMNRPSRKTEPELETFLASANDELSDQEWMATCSDVFCRTVKADSDNISYGVLVKLLKKVVEVQLKLPDDYQAFPLTPCNVTDVILQRRNLSAIQTLGTKMTIKYGKHLKMLTGSTKTTEGFSILLKKSQYFLQSQQRILNSDIKSIHGDYSGHDWFVSTIFILMSGDRECAWSFLYHFSSLLASGFLWMQRLHKSIHLPDDLAMSSIHPVFSTVCHNVELILQLELPHIFSAFKLSGFSPAQICQHWLFQCFWNYLDFGDICLYICMCLLMGPDYQVYFCISLLKHLQPKILTYTQQQQLQVFLKETSIEGYHIGDHIDFLQHLEEQYRSVVLKDMQTLLQG